MLTKSIDDFLRNQLKENEAFLLALSGGPDSIALFYTLITLPQYRFEVAHVDHGWRKDSKSEAFILQKMCQEHEVPFHLETLNLDFTEGNLEEICRKKRLEFFRSVCNQRQLKAVMLGHHQDDLAETILKRIFEGSGLAHLYGFSDVADNCSLILWRPLLAITKPEIVHWLQQNNHSYFFDHTNEDQRFLRARMRQHIIPLLNQYFGKNINDNLVRIARQSHQLRISLQKELLNFEKSIIEGPFGICLKFFECKTDILVFHEWLTQQGFHLSHQLLKQLYDALDQKKANRKFFVHAHAFFADRGYLFITRPSERVWNIHIEQTQSHQLKLPNWLDLWQGETEAILPLESDFQVVKYQQYHISNLRKWMTNHKVPDFFKIGTPLIIDKNHNVIHEFLTGKILSNHKQLNSNNYFKIKISPNNIV